jgi:hypothetical protein
MSRRMQLSQAAWPFLALATLSCSSADPTSQSNSRSASEPKQPPTSNDIKLAGPCKCDDVGTCAVEPIKEINDLECTMNSSGETASCGFELVPNWGPEAANPTSKRRVTMTLERQAPDRWCVAS